MATVAAALRNMRRRGVVRPARPADGTAGAAVTATGTVNPAGTPVQVAWGTGVYTPPPSGWSAPIPSDGQGNWSLITTLPAAGIWYLWARRAEYPHVASASGRIVVASATPGVVA